MKITIRSTPVLAAVAFLLAGTGGCYHYVPADTPAPAQGTPVRLRLERPESFELTSITVHNIGELDGEMIRGDNGELVVSAMWLRAVTGQGYPGSGWTLRIDREKVSGLEVRTLDRWRTAAVVVGGLVATWFGFEALEGSSGGSGGGGGGGAPK